MSRAQEHGWRRKYAEGRAEVEYTFRPRTSFTKENIGAVQEIIESAAYWCQVLDEKNVHISEKDMNFRLEKLFCFMTMPVTIQ